MADNSENPGMLKKIKSMNDLDPVTREKVYRDFFRLLYKHLLAHPEISDVSLQHFYGLTRAGLLEKFPALRFEQPQSQI